MTIGERIKKRREELGLSQDDLAKRMGYTSRSTVTKVEKGMHDITQTKVMEYARALDVTPAYLMGWEDEEQVNEELGNLLIEIRKTPMLLELARKFRYLSDNQKTSIMTILDGMVPEKNPEPPVPNWDVLIKNVPYHVDTLMMTDPSGETTELRKQPCKHPSQLHTDSQVHN